MHSENEREKKRVVFTRLTFDKGFKIVLGTEGQEKLLIKLINTIVPELKIEMINYLPTEQLGATVSERKSEFDIYIKDDKDRRYIIEMQMWFQEHFHARTKFYASYALQAQAREEREHQIEVLRKKWDYFYKPIYVISFVNFKNNYIAKDSGLDNYYIKSFGSRAKDGTSFGDEVNYIVVDLYNFNKKFEECSCDAEKWIYSLKNIHTLNEMPKGVEGTPLEELYRKAKMAAWEVTTKNENEEDMINLYEYEVSLQQQVEASKKEGREEERATIVQQLVESGFTTKAIAKALKMPVKEIDALISRC